MFKIFDMKFIRIFLGFFINNYLTYSIEMVDNENYEVVKSTDLSLRMIIYLASSIQEQLEENDKDFQKRFLLGTTQPKILLEEKDIGNDIAFHYCVTACRKEVK